MSLTREQREAVSRVDNLLLTACPGSGKTRTITAKLVAEIEPLRDSPRGIACITYTNSAVHEIEQRALSLLEPGDDRYFIVATIHSFCHNNILRPFAWRLPRFAGLPRVLTRDRPEFEEIVRYACDKVNYHEPTPREYEAFEALNLDVDGNLIGVALQNEIVRRAAPYFWERCEDEGFIDFCNIIYKSYCLLRDHLDIAQSLAARYPWFLIDEFQDTTELQIELLKLIHATGRSTFFLVGDPAQSIYAFTGARPELLQPFARHIGARTDISLSGNFRSNPQIVAHGERLFPRIPPMTSAGKNKTCIEQPKLIETDSTFDALTDDFLPRLADLGIPFGESTILAREWAPLIQLSRRLRDFGVAVVGPGARPYRRSRLFATLAEQLCGAIIDPQPETPRYLERALFNAIHDITAQPRFDVFTFQGRVTIVRLMRQARQFAAQLGGADWLDQMSTIAGDILTLDEWIAPSQAGLFYASVQEMKSDMQRQNVDIANLSIDDLGLFASPTKALRLSTIHYAKGREYDAVALIGIKEGTFPNFRSRTHEDVEADKRLFYVGVTRARRVLQYIYEPDRFGNAPSRFLGPEGVNVIEQ